MSKNLKKINKYRQPLWRYVLSPKRIIFLTIAIFIFTAFALENLSIKTFAATGINRTINFQGKVVNSNGTNVADGQYTFVFKLYDAAAAGANPWTETQNNVQVTAGIFRVSLGSVTSFASANVDFNTDNLYLGINFNSDGEMTPRVRFAAVPYAINAEKVAGLTVTNTSGTLTIPNSKTVQFGGAFTTDANDISFTTSGGTTLALPTTGTLATLAGSENLSNKTFTSTVTFNGVATDITTGTNEALTIAANGTGNLLVQSQSGAQAALIVNKTGLGDIFTASSAGITKFTIISDGTASSSAGFTVNGVGSLQSTNNQTLTLGGGATGNLILGRTGQVVTIPGFDCSSSGSGGKLTTTSGGVLTCAADGGGTAVSSPFVESTILGTISQINNTEDFLIGGIATTSAKFAVLGIAGTTNVPSASVSAQNALGQALVLRGDGSIQTTRFNTLTIGGTTTGAINVANNTESPFTTFDTVNSRVGIGTTAPGSALDVVGSLLLGANSTIDARTSGTLTIGNAANTSGLTLGKSGATTTFNSTSWTATPTISGLITGTLGVSIATGQSYTGAGTVTLSSAADNNLTLNSQGIGNLVIAGDFDSQVLIGATGASSKFPFIVRSGIGNNAAVVIDNLNNGDLFTASASGITKFIIKNDGTASSSAGFTIDGLGALQSTNSQTLTLGGSDTGNIQFSPGNSTSGLFLDKSGNVTIGPLHTNAGYSLEITNPNSGSTLIHLKNPTDNSELFITPTNIGTELLTASGNNLMFRTNGNQAFTPFILDSSYRVGMGTSTPVSQLHVTRPLPFGTTGKALAIFDQIENQDILTASAGGVTKFTITNNGIASSSAGFTIDGLGAFQSTKNQTLTIGGNSTGDIQFKPGNVTTPTLYLASNGAIGFNGSFGSAQNCLISSGTGLAPIWGSCVTGSLGWWNLNAAQGTLYPINTTLDMLWGGTSTASAGFHLYGSAASGTTPVASISANTSFAGLVVDNSGTGDILSASSAGNTRFTLFQNGNVTIGNTGNNGYKLEVQGSVKIGNNTSTDDIVKQTTSDFTQGGSSISTNDGVDTVTTSGNQLKLVTDLIGAGATLTAPAAHALATGTNITTGSVAFQRADKKFVIYVGGAATSRIYDPYGDNWIAGPGTSAAVNMGAGANVFQRADGAFMILHGGAVTSTTVYTPGGSANMGVTAVGPVTSAAVGVGSLIIRRTDGKVLVIHGNGGQTTSIYDPTQNTFMGGSSTGQNITTGSFTFQRPDGKWVIGIGGSTTTVIYDPATTTSGAGGGDFVAGPALTTGTPGAGTHVIQLPDGRYMVLVGGSGNTQIYDNISGTFSAGSTLVTDTVGAGGHAFQRSDGKWVVVVGGTSKNLQLYDPTSGANGSFAQLTGVNGLIGATGAGVGASTLQRPDGKYIVIHGNGAQLSTVYDAGWNTTGTWISEDINNTKISTYSAMMWSANPQSANNNARIDQETINFAVKTGDSTSSLGNNSYRSLQDSGDLIRSYGNSQYAKIQVTFTVPIRSYVTGATAYIGQSNIWKGEGSTFYRRSLIQPTVFSMRIQNPIVSYGDPTGGGDPAFGRNFATGSATLEGVVTDNSNRLSLATLRNFPTATASAGFLIASASANLGATVGAGAHTIERNNGQFLTIVGNGTTTTRIYDVDSNSWSTGPTLPSAAGAGANSFLLPDGRFFTVLGNGSSTTIFDPQSNVFITGPNLYGVVGAGANTFVRPDGFFVIINGGGLTDTNILDPYTMAITKGPFVSMPVNSGGLNIRRPDGRIVVFGGTVAATSTSVYDPATNAFAVGTTTTTGTTSAGDGAVQTITGRWLITRSAAVTNFYDPITNSFSAGPSLIGGNIATGSFIIPRSDGKVLISRGSGTTVTSIYDPQIPTLMTAGPTLPCTLGAGAHIFQRQTGEYMVVCGGAGGNTAIIDAGWNMGGTYTSEQISAPNLSATSSIFWKNAGQGAITLKYRTASSRQALGVASWKDAPTSGSYLTPTIGDSWLQVRFDLQGTLQDLPGAKTRAWLASDSGGAVVYYRAVQTPVLQYWKLMNIQDPTLLTLSSGGSNVFRFSSDGQAYTSDNGAWNSGGADLAERYSSKDSLQAGEVVSLDRFNPQNTKRSTLAYDQNAMGVVSTQPGFVAGAYTADSYPVALVGRVPVKVSTENGAIHSGDYLTSASIPGYAMKATVGGRVLGQAMEDFDVSNSAQVAVCPKFGAGNLPATQCGTITVFVNLTSYNGQSVDVAVKDSGFSLNERELPSIAGMDFTAGTDARRQQEMLGFLKTQKDNGQGIYTDRVSATQEIISPQIVTDLLIAKKIKAESIEGLEIITNSIETLSNRISSGSAVTNFSDKLTLLAHNQDDFQNQMASIAAKLEKMNNLNLLTMINVSSGEGALTTVANLAVFNTATFAQASVLDSLQVGNNMTFSASAINTVGADLEIQSLKQGAVSFLGGLIKFDTDGQVTFAEDVSFQKNVSVEGVLSAHIVASTELQLAQGVTTVISDTEVDATAAAGLVTLKKGTDHMKVNNPLVKENSYIFITPKSKTSRTLFLLEQVQTEDIEQSHFTVGIDRESSEDIKFNYLIVN